MRSVGRRRVALFAGAVTAAAVALAGCSAGQVAETAQKRPSNQGVNIDNSNRSVYIRNLSVAYNGTEGYAAGESAPLEVGIYNQTEQEVTVLISSPPAASQQPSEPLVSAKQIGLTGGSGSSAAPSPAASASSEPGEPSASLAPARVTLPALGYQTFLPGDQQELQAAGLTGALKPGGAVNLVFEFSNGAEPLTIQAPMGIPLSPAPRGSGNPNENVEPEGIEGQGE